MLCTLSPKAAKPTSYSFRLELELACKAVLRNPYEALIEGQPWNEQKPEDKSPVSNLAACSVTVEFLLPLSTDQKYQAKKKSQAKTLAPETSSPTYGGVLNTQFQNS